MRIQFFVFFVCARTWQEKNEVSIRERRLSDPGIEQLKCGPLRFTELKILEENVMSVMSKERWEYYGIVYENVY